MWLCEIFDKSYVYSASIVSSIFIIAPLCMQLPKDVCFSASFNYLFQELIWPHQLWIPNFFCIWPDFTVSVFFAILLHSLCQRLRGVIRKIKPTCFRIGGAEDNFIFYIEYCFFFLPGMKLRWEYNILKHFQSVSCLMFAYRHILPRETLWFGGKSAFLAWENVPVVKQ